MTSMDADAVLATTPTSSAMAVGDELSVFDTRSGQAVSLNRTAAAVYQEIDGIRPVRDIVTRVAATFGQPEHDVEADILAALDAMAEAGLLSDG